MSAFTDGVDAYNRGDTPDQNPYPEGSNDHEEWDDGFYISQEAEEGL